MIRILLVEDNDGDARLVEETLRDLSFEGLGVSRLVLERARSLAEARGQMVELGRNGDRGRALVLLDLGLPDATGLETLRGLKATGIDVPTVVLTGLHDEGLELAAIEHGAEDFLRKDELEPIALWRTIHYALGRASVREALHHQEALAQGVLRSVDAHIAVLDEDGTIVETNDAWERFAAGLGGGDRAGVGSNYFEVTRRAAEAGDPDAAAALKGIRAVLREEAPRFTLEYPCHGPDEKRWFLLSVTPFRNARPGVVVSHQNVTERRLAEDETRRSERRYRSLFEQNPDPLFVVDPETMAFLDANPAAAEMYGYAREELLGMTPLELHTEESRREMLARLEAGETEPVDSGPWENVRKDGSRFLIRVTGSLIDYEGGEARLIRVRDVTEAERAAREVERARDLFASVFHLSPEPIVLSRAETGELVDVNDAFCDYHGFAREELLGESALELELWCDPHERDEVLRGVERDGSVSGVEVCHRTRDGEIRHGVVSAKRLEVRGENLTLFVVHDITDRKEAEETLEASERRHRRILETVNEGITLVDVHGGITFANRAAEEILGLERSEITGLTYNDPEFSITDWDGRPYPDEALPFRRVMRTGQEVVDVEHAIVWPDGERRLLSVNAAPLTDAGGAMEGIVGSFRDVTERRSVEAKYASLFDLSPVPIALTDAGSGEILEVNAAMEAVSGRNRTDLVGRTAEEIRLWVEPEERREVLESLRRSGEVRRFETRHRAAPGDVRDVLLSARTLELGGREGILWILHDISEQKRAQRRLAESEQRYRSLFERNPTPVCSLDLEGRFTSANRAFQERLGLSEEELLGRTFDPFIDEPDLGRVQQLFARAAAGEPQQYEVRAHDASGERVLGQMTNLPIVVDGQVVGVYGVAEDITEQREAEEELRQSEKRYRSLFEDSRDAIVTVAPEGRVLDANRAAEELVGYELDEIREVDITDLYADPAQRGMIVGQLERTGSVKNVDVRVRHRDGTEMECLVTSSATRSPDGETLFYQTIVRDVTDMKQLQRQLEHRALHDWLTDLPNRALLRNRLQQALGRADRGGKPFAVLFLDVDRFKHVNDSLGHPEGDRLLVELGRRLSATVRQQDTVARVGGDEFTVLIEDLDGSDAAEAAAARILEALEDPFELDGGEVGVDVSLGLVVYASRQDCGCDDGSHAAEACADELVRRADLAMYRAKERPGSRHHLFDPDVDGSTGGILEREAALRRALEREELDVHYQPVVDLATGRICGVEALARWRSPRQGWVSPGEFIPLAEETGLIEPLGAWILDRALADFGEVVGSACCRAATDLGLFVNLSPVQLEDPGLSDRIADALERHGLDPGRVSFEVTETAVTRSVERVRALRGLGVRVAIDDFGTGYSSLGNLRHFQVDTLKIDMEFVRGIGVNPEDEAIVRTIVNLGKTLRTDVVAEGVEEESQLGILRSLGCDRAQGYLFSRPLPLAETLALLEDDPVWR